MPLPISHIHNGDDTKSRDSTRRPNLETADICREYPDKFAFVAVLHSRMWKVQ